MNHSICFDFVVSNNNIENFRLGEFVRKGVDGLRNNVKNMFCLIRLQYMPQVEQKTSG